MRHFLWIIIILICGLEFSCKNFHNGSKNSDTRDSLSQNKVKANSIDSLYKVEISVANKRFKISDSKAIEIVRQVKNLREIIDWKYKDDSTVFNVANIDGIPNDTCFNWTINIRQEQPLINQSASLMFLIVNANNGNIKIWDIPKDTLLTVDEWRKKEK